MIHTLTEKLITQSVSTRLTVSHSLWVIHCHWVSHSQLVTHYEWFTVIEWVTVSDSQLVTHFEWPIVIEWVTVSESQLVTHFEWPTVIECVTHSWRITVIEWVTHQIILISYPIRSLVSDWFDSKSLKLAVVTTKGIINKSTSSDIMKHVILSTHNAIALNCEHHSCQLINSDLYRVQKLKLHYMCIIKHTWIC